MYIKVTCALQPFTKDDWRPHFTYVCPSTPHEDVHIEALTRAIKGGNRRKFTVIDKTAMLQSVSSLVRCWQLLIEGEMAVWLEFCVFLHLNMDRPLKI